MELKGTVLNVVPFGAFVDIGLKESGLVHISQMANRYIKSPYDVVAVGDVITVWVIEVKPGEKKISLSMIPPGQERRPPERGRFADRGPRGGEPRGPGGPPPQHQQPPAGERPGFAPRGERPGAGPRGDRPGYGPRGGQGPGGQRFGGPRPGGPRPGGPPPRAGGPAAPPAGGTAPAEGPAPPPQTPPPRKPSKPKPLPNLTTEKKTGKAALNTFAELAAFFKTKDEPEPPVKPVEEPKAEVPPPEAPQPEAPAEQPTPGGPP
jgi:hypothetical protein